MWNNDVDWLSKRLATENLSSGWLHIMCTPQDGLRLRTWALSYSSHPPSSAWAYRNPPRWWRVHWRAISPPWMATPWCPRAARSGSRWARHTSSRSCVWRFETQIGKLWGDRPLRRGARLNLLVGRSKGRRAILIFCLLSSRSRTLRIVSVDLQGKLWGMGGDIALDIPGSRCCSCRMWFPPPPAVGSSGQMSPCRNDSCPDNPWWIRLDRLSRRRWAACNVVRFQPRCGTWFRAWLRQSL